MSVLMDSLLYGVPLSRVIQAERRAVDAEFLRRWNESHRYDYSDEQIAAVLNEATAPLVTAAQLNAPEEKPE